MQWYLAGGEEPQPTDPTGGTTESTQPGGQTENTQATEDAGGTQVTEPDPTEADPTEPEATEPEATEPDETEPGKTEPAETEPAETEPAETEPEETEPEETEPEETEPEETKGPWDGNGYTGPANTEPGETEPGETEPGETEHEHSWARYEIPPTCTERGYIVYYCTTCDWEQKDQNGSRLGHDWTSDWVITKEPTVDAPGEKQRTCSRCGTVTEAIPPLDESGEAYESYIDPRIEVKEYRICVGYDYEKISVTDFRTWGDPPSIWVNEDGSLTVVYYQQDGMRVEVVVEVPEEGYIGECRIKEDGTYLLTRTGSYANSN